MAFRFLPLWMIPLSYQWRKYGNCVMCRQCCLFRCHVVRCNPLVSRIEAKVTAIQRPAGSRESRQIVLSEKRFDQAAYVAAYQKTNLERHSLNFNRVTESDMISFIHSRQEPFAAYIKRLIRQDMERQKHK